LAKQRLPQCRSNRKSKGQQTLQQMCPQIGLAAQFEGMEAPDSFSTIDPKREGEKDKEGIQLWAREILIWALHTNCGSGMELMISKQFSSEK